MKSTLLCSVVLCLGLVAVDGAGLLKSLKEKKNLLQTLQQTLGKKQLAQLAAASAVAPQLESQDVPEQNEVEEAEVKKAEKPKGGLVARLKEKMAGAKTKITGKAPFVPKDKRLRKILKFYSGFPQLNGMVAKVSIFAEHLKDYEKNTKLPILEGVTTDEHPHLLVLACALATTKSNFKLLVQVLWASLEAYPKERNKALWKYMALCALKLKPASVWGKKSPLQMFKAATKVTLKSKSQDLFSVPIGKAGVVPGLGKTGKLPWRLRPRTAEDLLNGTVLMMASGGRFRPLTKTKTISAAWKECNKLTDADQKRAIKSLLNRTFIDIKGLGSEVDTKIARALMTRSAKALLATVKEAGTVGAPSSPPTSARTVEVEFSERQDQPN